MASLVDFAPSTAASADGQEQTRSDNMMPGQWQIETVNSTGNVGYFNSLALNGSENPSISYQDYSNRDLKYASWKGSVWQIETVDSTGDVGWFTSLVLDSSGNPSISYYDWTNGGLKYARQVPLIIQALVDAASPGDTIIVPDGTYIENVNVNIPLTIQSEHGANSTIVQAANSGDHVF